MVWQNSKLVKENGQKEPGQTQGEAQAVEEQGNITCRKWSDWLTNLKLATIRHFSPVPGTAHVQVVWVPEFVRCLRRQSVICPRFHLEISHM